MANNVNNISNINGELMNHLNRLKFKFLFMRMNRIERILEAFEVENLFLDYHVFSLIQYKNAFFFFIFFLQNMAFYGNY